MYVRIARISLIPDPHDPRRLGLSVAFEVDEAAQAMAEAYLRQQVKASDRPCRAHGRCPLIGCDFAAPGTSDRSSIDPSEDGPDDFDWLNIDPSDLADLDAPGGPDWPGPGHS